ncbi:retrotransposon protein, putative, ty1-copia subclass [Tanacetum coccineum]
MIPLRFRDESNMVAYAFAAAEEEDTHEPLTYKEAVACEDNSKQKLVSYKWLFKIKEGIKGVQRPRYKARLVAHGFTQRAGIDYNKVFSPVVRHTSIRVILALTGCKDYELEQLDVKTSFLHGNLKEVIYMRQPPGYEHDDMLIAYKSKAEIGSTKTLLKREFDMKELREVKKILGMEIIKDQSRKILRVSQSGHFKLSLKDFPVRDCDVERRSKVKMILKYLRGTANVGLVYGINRSNHMDVTGFVDSDYAKDPNKEEEYMALTEAVKEAIWLRGLLEELGVELNSVAVNCDNQGAIHLSQNHVFHERTKHINVRYHFIIEVLEAKMDEVLKAGTKHNAADALTKMVHGHKLQHCLELLSVGIG